MDHSGMCSKRLRAEDPDPPSQSGQQPRQLRTTLFLSNIHCPSCVDTIQDTLFDLSPAPLTVSPSIVSHSVDISHYSTLPAASIVAALEKAGFDIHSAFQQEDDNNHPSHQVLPQQKLGDDWEDNLEQAVKKWRQTWLPSSGKGKQRETTLELDTMGKRRKHAENCPACQAELQNGITNGLLDPKSQKQQLLQWPAQATMQSPSHSQIAIIDGTSSPDSGRSTRGASDEKIDITVASAAGLETWLAEIAIVGMTCSSCVASITEVVQRLPFTQSVDVALLTNSASVVYVGKEHARDIVEAIEGCGFDATMESNELISESWKATYSIEGMTCSACIGSITAAVKDLDYVGTVNVNLIANTATVVFKGRENAENIKTVIQDTGFDATLESLVKIGAQAAQENAERTVWIRIDGMYCHHCTGKVLAALDDNYLDAVVVEKVATHQDPVLRIRYKANPPDFTIRTILATIQNIDPEFHPYIHHPPTIEDKSRELQTRERHRILFRLLLSTITTIPTFVIGVVAMSLLASDSPILMYIMEPMWAGSVPRVQWALFILATPVYFFAADTFHRKAFKELKALWRPGSKVPIWRRFVRFGSMSLLMSLGTTIAYLASIAEIIMASVQKPSSREAMNEINNSFYFDSVVFLTFFILIGRYLEAYTKAKTGDAVTSLGNLRPSEAMLVNDSSKEGTNIAVDLLEIGDVVRVPHGASPPFDGTIVDGETSFDESSLTGESRLVPKKAGDTVFSGTVNKSGPVSVRISSVSGTSMLDQIIKVVREGQTRRAPVERAADIITSHFVPFVVAVGITTWLVWLALGLSGVLPRSWLDVTMGGWPVWSLRFAIATFVVACPCGIGLAAPTALFVGGGMAAKHGILVKGGGEAFQEASALDCIVFDKTGTITQGGEPSVTDYEACNASSEVEILGMAMALEQQSGHPVAGAVVEFCKSKQSRAPEAIKVEEVPGRGMKGSFILAAGTNSSKEVGVLVGNERLLSEHGVPIDAASHAKLRGWKKEGKSVVLAALSTGDGNDAAAAKPTYTLAAVFAISDALRPEALATVSALRSRGIAVWMLSGDNADTAAAVAAQVGIDADNVIAGVLPDQKADKIQYLQKSLPKRRGRGKTRATVAMVGDGINDSPALTMADVGIAIGSGSDVAISSADFILISSNLDTLLTLIDLSRTVFRRVWFNFGWALCYNVVAMPVAAGVLYPVVSGGRHLRLDPVWASLAMALSSVSVVTSSLLLRSRVPWIGYRAKQRS